MTENWQAVFLPFHNGCGFFFLCVYQLSRRHSLRAFLLLLALATIHIMGTEMNTTPFASRQETNRRNSLRSNDRRQRTRQRRQRILLVESLEIRRVLAAPAAVDDGYVASEDVVLSVPGPIEYDSVVLADNPLAYWRLGEAAGPSVRDHTGNEHTGSADAGVTFGQPNVVPNLTDTAARTVGTDRITVPGFEKFGVGATGFTTEYWLTINSPIGTHYNIVGDGESGGDFYFMNYLTNTGKIRPHFSFANTVSMDSAATLQSGQTYHVATTWDAVTGQGSIYIDGALDSTAAIGVNPPSNSNNAVFIGKDNREAGGDFTLDEVAFSNHPLSLEQVQLHFNAMNSGLLDNDSDADGDSINVALVDGADDIGDALSLASGAVVTVQADGSFSYDPNGQFESLLAGETATDTFTYTALESLPTSAAGSLTVHLAADAGISLSGSTVTSWADQSAVNGNNDAVQSNGGPLPQLVSGGLAGKDVIRFSGTQKLELPTTSALGIQNSDYEIFVVAQTNSGGVQFLTGGGTLEQYELHLNGASGARFIPNGFGGGAGAADIGVNGEYVGSDAHVYDVRVESNSGIVAVDGSQSADVTANARSAVDTPLILGARGNNSLHLVGDIAEVLIYDRALTSTERAAVNTYLTDRWVRVPGDIIDLNSIGPTGLPVPANLANAPGAVAFAKDVFANGGAASHQINHLNNGVYGNANSWIGNSANSFAGIDLNGSVSIDRIAIGRSNVTAGDPCGGGVCIDRNAGTYTFQFTTAATPNAATADSEWITIDAVEYTGGAGDHLRHLYSFDAVDATGIRVLTSTNGIAIDEIEVFGPDSFTLDKIGAAGIPVPDNVANAPGAVAFAKDVFAGGGAASHQIDHLNDGLYGNSNSWIGGSVNTFVGVDLNGLGEIDSIAFGRSNVTGGDPCGGGVCTDRTAGDYVLQFTTVPAPDASTPDGNWTTLDSVTYTGAAGEHLRHAYSFGTVDATGIRILVSSSASAIDEIEVYRPGPDTLSLEEVGPTGNPVPANLATAPGATAFAKDVFAGGGAASHQIDHLNDGLYGNSNSWIGGSANTFVGIDLNGAETIDSIAFGRSNLTSGDPCGGGVCTDRTVGTYIFQYTNVAAPNASTPDGAWTTIDGVTYVGAAGEHLRHLYSFGEVEANGVRILVSNGASAIDEIEVYRPSFAPLTLVQTGPTGNPVPANLATAAGATAFAKDVFAGGGAASHQIDHLNDGLYGNTNSWIGNSANTFVGIDLNGTESIDSIAFGRSNLTTGDPCGGGVCTDRTAGTYVFQFTNVASPDASTPAGDWTTIDSVTYVGAAGEHLRHLYSFGAVDATGVRLLVSNGASAIDEIEVYEAFDSQATVTVTVVGANEAPVAVDDPATGTIATDADTILRDYRELVVADSPVSYWTFDEANTGTTGALDHAGNNNGVFQGTAVRTDGLVGVGAAQFPAAAPDAINVGTGGGDFSFGTGMTIETLFTSNYLGAGQAEFFRKEDGNNRILLSFQSTGNTNNASGQLIGDGNSPGISFGINVGGYKEMDVTLDGQNGRPTVADLSDGRLHQLVATFDSATSTKAMYIDGVLVGSVNNAGNITSGGGAAAFIGSSNGGGEPFDGTLDEVAIYDRALSAAEVSEHFVASNRLLTNDTDIEGDDLQIIGFDAVSANGGIVLVSPGGSLEYNPNGAFNNLGLGATDTDTFTYTISDGNGGTDSATVTVVVTGANAPPVANDDSIDVLEDAAVQDITAQLKLNDSDPEGDAFTIVSVDSTGTVGAVSLSPSGDVTYGPNGLFESLSDGVTATDTFIYTLNGGDTAVATITITGQNDLPLGVSDTIITSEESAISSAAPTYQSTVVADRPLGYWRLGDSGPSVTDLSGNGHDGTADAGVVFGQTGLVPGDADTAVQTSGNDRIVVPGFEKFGAGATGFTTEYWITLDSAPTAFYNIVGDGESGGDFYFMNYLTNTGRIRPHYSFANTPVSTDSNIQLQVGQTYHVATTWDAATGESNIFVDGVLDKTVVVSANVPSNTNNQIFIGKDNREPGGNFTLDEVAFYDRPLSIGEVQSHFNLVGSTLLSNDSDIDGDSLSVSEVNGNAGDVGSAVTLGSGAELTVNNDGNYVYDPNGAFEFLGAGAVGSDTFTYTVTDGNAAVTVSATVLITGVNDAPVASNDTLSTDEDTPIDLVVTDIYSTMILADNPLAYWRLGEAAGPAVADSSGNGNNGTAEPGVVFGAASLVSQETDTAATFAGTDRIVTAGFEKFGAGASGFTAEYWITLNAAPTSFSNIVGDGEGGGDFYFMNYLTTTGQIRPHYSFANTPVSTDSNTQLQVGQTYHVATTWDSATGESNIYIDGALDKSIVVSTNTPSNTNNAVFIGRDNREPGGNFTLDEVAFYDRPLSFGEVSEHFSGGQPTIGLLANDTSVDGPGLLVISADANSAAGAPVSVAANGGVSYDPTGLFDSLPLNGATTDTFDYVLSDSIGGTDIATVTVTINGVNDAPVATPVTGSTDEDAGTASFNLIGANATDIDTGTVLVLSAATQDVGNSDRDLAGAFVLNGNALEFDANLFNDLPLGGSETIVFDYTVDDQSGAANSTASSTLTLTINGVNDAPAATPVTNSTNEDAGVVSIALVGANATDIDMGTVIVLDTVVQDVAGSDRDLGAVFNVVGNSLELDTNLFNDLPVGGSETIVFNYTIDDQSGAANNTATSTLTVTIDGVNDAPTGDAGGAYTANEGSSVVLDASASSDPDQGTNLTYSWDLNADGIFGDATGVNPTVTWTELSALVPNVDDGPGTYPVVVQVDDGIVTHVSASIDLTLTNSAPTASISGATDTVPNLPVDFILSAADFSATDQNAGFTFVVNWGDGTSPLTEGPGAAAGSIATHAFPDLGFFTVSVTAMDKDGGISAPVTHTIEVVPVAKIGDNVFVGGTNGQPNRIIVQSAGPDEIFVRYNNRRFGGFDVSPTSIVQIFGGDGDDRISITNCIETEIHGEAGNDNISGGSCNDNVFGGAGRDVILVGEGDNIADGGPGNDTIQGRSGVDILRGGTGNDWISGGAGNDELFGDEGNDRIIGGGGHDLLVGAFGSDILLGGTGHDVLVGGFGFDSLRGNNGDDLLIGGLGLDGLKGDRGRDVLIAGQTSNEDIESSLQSLLVNWSVSRFYGPAGTIDTDGDKDALNGGGGIDELFVGGEDSVSNRGNRDAVNVL